MVIVMAIIGIITVIVITSQGAFNKSLILSNAAYDLGLAIRATQHYGLGSKVTTSLGTNTGYGLEFIAGPTAKTFTQFADSYPASVSTGNCHGVPITGTDSPDAKIGNCIYEGPLELNPDQVLTTYTLNSGITVDKVCAYDGAWTCTPTIGRLDIVFVRPDPTPLMSVDGMYSTTNSPSRACITLVSPQGGSRSVLINSTGEIDAAAAACPPLP